MVAPRRTKKIFCTVIRVSAADVNCMKAATSRFSSRPSELVPWADPYIAQLVTNLQKEIRHERTQLPGGLRTTEFCVDELEPPSPILDNDWDWDEEPRWSYQDEA